MQIKRGIEQWLDGHDSRNLAALEKKTGVAYSTLRRIMQNEAEPQLETALNIANIIFTKSETIDYLNKHFPVIGKHLSETNIDNEATNEDLPMLLRDRNNFIFITFASAKDTTREELLSLAGAASENQLDRLLELGILREINSKIVAGDDAKDFCIINAKTMLEEIKIMANIFNISNLQKSYLSISSGGISDEGLIKMLGVYKEANNQAKAIKEQYPGGNVFYRSVLLNQL